MDIRLEIVRLINQVRREYGVSALPVNQSLMDAAQDYSMGMHTSHKNRLECETALAYGYPHGFRSNLTVFTGTGLNRAAETAVANRVKSSGHFEAMIDPRVDSIGVGVTTDGVKICSICLQEPLMPTIHTHHNKENSKSGGAPALPDFSCLPIQKAQHSQLICWSTNATLTGVHLFDTIEST